MGEKAFHTIEDVGGVTVFAARKNEGSIAFDSTGDRKDTDASFAVRCSMSIPYLFVPPTVDGARVYDGGIRANFPLKNYLQKAEEKSFLGLYLSEPQKHNGSVLGDLFSIPLEGEESAILQEYSRDILVLNTWPTDFKGTRPRAPRDQRTEWAYIFGAICPAKGKGAGLVMPWCDTDAMAAHLIEISAAVDRDRLPEPE